MRIYTFLLLMAALLCGGCIPIPHTSIRFPQMDGRVVDGNTRQPIAGALVAIHASPSVSTKSDSAGRFHIERQKNFHIGYDLNLVCGPGDIGGRFWSHELDISAPGYAATRVSAYNHHKSYDQAAGVYVLEDVFLTPSGVVPPK